MSDTGGRPSTSQQPPPMLAQSQVTQPGRQGVCGHLPSGHPRTQSREVPSR